MLFKTASLHELQSKTNPPTRRLPGVRLRHAPGFSLVEIMVVLVIIGLLAGLVGVNVRGYLVKAKRNAATAEIATICDALEAFYTEYDRYPSNDEGLLVLTEPSERLPEPLLDREPVDPWGRAYIYNQPGREGAYEVMSLGADGREGGDSKTADADLGNWDFDTRDLEPAL
ncbi:MAG: type II secretion system major pseudopilin GspG [Planctomycetota bacterium]